MNGNRCAELDHCQSAGPAAGHDRGQHPRRVLMDAPLYPAFSLTGVMAGHRVGFPGHCEFLPCLESVPVDGERGAGI